MQTMHIKTIPVTTEVDRKESAKYMKRL